MDLLQEFFAAHPRAALGFSGGVDSSYLLYAARQAGVQIRPYYVRTAFQPEFEFRDAVRMANLLSVEMQVIPMDILQNKEVAANPQNRCYYCKKAIFSALKEAALKDGFSVLFDGTNASDEETDRPGMQALRELSILSPLREAGLTKEMIRQRSKEAGLFTWDKPAYACLATRVQAGTPLDRDTLRKIEGAENALMARGYRDLRVRVFYGAARIQLTDEELERASKELPDIRSAVAPYFETILLDLKGRKS